MEIGARIKQRREELGMSQEELAYKIGYKSRSSINKIEIDGRGLPQKKIVAFAKALETTPAYLMGWDTVPILDNINSYTIEETIHHRMKQLNITNEELAKETNCTLSLIDSIISGNFKCPLLTLENIAYALKLSLSDLFPSWSNLYNIYSDETGLKVIDTTGIDTGSTFVAYSPAAYNFINMLWDISTESNSDDIFNSLLLIIKDFKHLKYLDKLCKLNNEQQDIIFKMIDQMAPNEEATNEYSSTGIPNDLESRRVIEDTNDPDKTKGAS